MITLTLHPYRLHFNFPAGTSRGILEYKDTWFIKALNTNTLQVGIGECGPIPGLSPDDIQQYFGWMDIINNNQFINKTINQTLIQEIIEQLPFSLPALKFGVETALTELLRGKERLLYSEEFMSGSHTIPINGLIWMGDPDFMIKQITEKMDQGYTCLKLKIGANDFRQECTILKSIRSEFNGADLSVRLDANGAFSPDEALQKIVQLAKYDIHSIEQPIQPGQWEQMTELCSNSPIPIALDEELIGIDPKKQGNEIINRIKPQYLIFKPSLLGGISITQQWIRLANEHGASWWLTSMLESNIGLNAIAQFAATTHANRPQGLGTGQIYRNNIASPLFIDQGKIGYDPTKKWGDFDAFLAVE